MSTSQSQYNQNNDCASKYSIMMGLIHNIEHSVEKMMKSREATIKYNNCIFIRQQKNKSNIIAISSFR